jgi:ribosomal protein S27AE
MTYTCPAHADVTSNKPGKCSRCGTLLNLTAKEKMKMEVMKIYTCPMHPEVTSDNPGKCPKCGMDLTEKKQ